MLNIGSHLSISKGFYAIGRDALSIGATIICDYLIHQLFYLLCGCLSIADSHRDPLWYQP